MAREPLPQPSNMPARALITGWGPETGSHFRRLRTRRGATIESVDDARKPTFNAALIPTAGEAIN
jgi:hypothetical protein